MPLGNGGFLPPLRWFRVSFWDNIDFPLPCRVLVFPLLFELGHVVVGQAHDPLVPQHTDEVVQVYSGAFEMAGCPVRGSQVVDKRIAEFGEGEGVVVGWFGEQVTDLGGAEQDIQDGMAVGKQFGGEGALALANAGELFVRVSADVFGFALLGRAEVLRVPLALPHEDVSQVAVGSLADEAHVAALTSLHPAHLPPLGGDGQVMAHGSIRQRRATPRRHANVPYHVGYA